MNLNPKPPRWPGKQFDELFHVGHLEGPAAHGMSLDGPCLSVSEVPGAWKRIAKLGGRPTWRLTRPHNRFLDVHRLTGGQLEAIRAWGEQQGWVERANVWRAWTTDETGDWRFSCHFSKDQALAELDGMNPETIRVDSMPGLRALPQLVAYCGQRIDFVQAEAMLHVVFADRALHCDGVFWNDRLDLDAQTAPRAGLLAHRLADWLVEPVA